VAQLNGAGGQGRRGRAALAGVLALVLVLGGCSLSSSDSATKTVCIATDLPLVVTNSDDGKAAQDGANLAIGQARLGGGFTLVARNFDDSLNGQPSTDAATTNAYAITSDACVVALVGPLQDALAASEMPLVANSGLPVVSPGTASPGLTRAASATLYGFDFAALHPAQKPITFFRLPAPDDDQAAAAAREAIVNGQTKAFVVDDGGIYGRALAGFFARAYVALGGTVAGTSSLTSTAASAAQDLAAVVRASGAQVIYYGGGATGGGAALRLALGASGPGSAPMLGASGIASDASFVRQATASAAEGTEATRSAPDAASLVGEDAARFRASYRAQFDSDPTSASVLGYDAASVVIDTMQALIAAGQRPTRENVRQRLSTTTFQGLEGTISFDTYGDNVGTRSVSLYVVRGGAWVYLSRASTA
jgi:branched-chain amino acid transport system substrate-binding protein